MICARSFRLRHRPRMTVPNKTTSCDESGWTRSVTTMKRLMSLTVQTVSSFPHCDPLA
jgi:hypothetical protein